MGKFSKEIEELIPEWKEAFIAYSNLKKQVTEDGESDLVQLFREKDEVRVFFERLDGELNKVNQFFVSKESEFVKRGEIVNKQLETLMELQRIHREPNNLLGDFMNGKDIQRAEKMIRDAFVELYKALGLLKTYSSLNMKGFKKVLKKFDRVADQKASASYLKVVKTSYFISSNKVVTLMDDVESIFTKHFANNDRKKAKKFLKPQQQKESHMVTFFIGFFVGLFIVYSMIAILLNLPGNPESGQLLELIEWVDFLYTHGYHCGSC